MAGNGALDLSIRIMGKVDPSLVTAIKQTKGLTGDLASALTGTKSLGSTVANTLGVIGKTGLGIMATLTTASAVMIKKTTSMAEEYQAQAADAVKYVGGIMNDDGSIDPEKRATMEDAILKMTKPLPVAKGLYVAEVTEKTASFEPRARVVRVDWLDSDVLHGVVIPKVVYELV